MRASGWRSVSVSRIEPILAGRRGGSRRNETLTFLATLRSGGRRKQEAGKGMRNEAVLWVSVVQHRQYFSSEQLYFKLPEYITFATLTTIENQPIEALSKSSVDRRPVAFLACEKLP